MRKSLSNCFIILFMLSIVLSLSAQEDMILDIERINSQLSRQQISLYKRQYIFKEESSLLKKINPINLFFGGSLYFYQNVLSKHISADCLYMPSCSEFSKQAISETYLINGILLTIDRLNRCNIISAQDLKHYPKDEITNRYPDPITRYLKASIQNGE